jgi:hypothetical protein
VTADARSRSQAWRSTAGVGVGVVFSAVLRCASGSAGDHGVTCGARKVRLDKARKISLDMTLGQIESLLGPPDRDVGSGLFVLEWSCTDGTRIHVSAAPNLPTTKPVSVTFSSGK